MFTILCFCDLYNPLEIKGGKNRVGCCLYQRGKFGTLRLIGAAFAGGDKAQVALGNMQGAIFGEPADNGETGCLLDGCGAAVGVALRACTVENKTSDPECWVEACIAQRQCTSAARQFANVEYEQGGYIEQFGDLRGGAVFVSVAAAVK